MELKSIDEILAEEPRKVIKDAFIPKPRPSDVAEWMNATAGIDRYAEAHHG